jgi:two-component system chemotaxis sensor kinase CheA
MRSDPGKGTSVEIVIPFAIASFQALVVEAGGVAAVVPLDTVRRSLRITPGEIVETADGDSLVHEGRSVPTAPLLGVIRPSAARLRLAQTSSAFVIETADGVAAFTVDRILGVGTVVMRPLPALLPAVPSVVGASLDPSGVPRLVLDPVSLVKAARRLGSSRHETGAGRPSILVIDDSLTTRMLEQSILESAGYDVGLAASGEEGLEKARAAAYALFLVDVEMPGIDGFTFIEQVRSDPALRQIPSILVTSRASAADRQRGRDVGAQGYVVKGDFDQGDLLEQIRTLVR